MMGDDGTSRRSLTLLHRKMADAANAIFGTSSVVSNEISELRVSRKSSAHSDKDRRSSVGKSCPWGANPGSWSSRYTKKESSYCGEVSSAAAMAAASSSAAAGGRGTLQAEVLAIDIGGADGASARKSVRFVASNSGIAAAAEASAEAEASGSGGMARGRIVSVEARPHTPRGGATPPPSPPPSPPAEAEHTPRAAAAAASGAARAHLERARQPEARKPRGFSLIRHAVHLDVETSSSQPGPERSQSMDERTQQLLEELVLLGVAPEAAYREVHRAEQQAANEKRGEKGVRRGSAMTQMRKTSLNQAGPPSGALPPTPETSTAEESSRRKFPIDLSTATKVAIATISSRRLPIDRMKYEYESGRATAGSGRFTSGRLGPVPDAAAAAGETDARGVSVVVEERPSQLASDSVSGSKRGYRPSVMSEGTKAPSFSNFAAEWKGAHDQAWLGKMHSKELRLHCLHGGVWLVAMSWALMCNIMIALLLLRNNEQADAVLASTFVGIGWDLLLSPFTLLPVMVCVRPLRKALCKLPAFKQCRKATGRFFKFLCPCLAKKKKKRMGGDPLSPSNKKRTGV